MVFLRSLGMAFLFSMAGLQTAEAGHEVNAWGVTTSLLSHLPSLGDLAAESSGSNSGSNITVQGIDATTVEGIGASTVSATMPPVAFQPHIVIFLFDDLGYHDLGDFSLVKRNQCKTPVMNGLMAGGIKLSSFYVQPVCSPTRAALMTGRYPIRYGGHVGTTPSLAGDRKGWAPDEIFLSEKMREAGYTTKMSGKWHLGRGSHKVTPTGKGFQEAYSKYEGGGDHWTHVTNIYADADGALWPGHPEYKPILGDLDLHHDYFVGRELIHKHIHDQNGTHSSDVIGVQAARMIAEHDSINPLFLYIPFQAPHWPVQNPPGTEERHMDILSKQRRKWCGLISHIDDNIGRVIAALEANQGMLDNTVIFAFSDNGGDVRTGASNYPYRGDKMTLWEGGTKTPAFVYSPNEKLIPASRRGTSSDVLGHVTDLFPTFLRLAGGTPASKTKPLDGVDLWESWVSGSSTSPRKELLYNIDPHGLLNLAGAFLTGQASSPGISKPDPSMMAKSRQMVMGNAPEEVSAIRVGNWKLIDGHGGRGDWYGTDPSPAWQADYIMGPDATDYEMLRSGGPFNDMRLGDGGQGDFFFSDDDGDFTDDKLKKLFLYDLGNDPTEQFDVSAQFPEKVAELRERIAFYAKSMVQSLLVEHMTWPRDKKHAVVAQMKTGQRQYPGLDYVVCDWWDEGYPENQAPGGALSKL